MSNYLPSHNEYNRDRDGSKFNIFGSSQGNNQYLSAGRGHYGQQESNHLEDTPSLTTGSTRSTSASVQGCQCSSHDECGNEQCREREREGEVELEDYNETDSSPRRPQELKGQDQSPSVPRIRLPAPSNSFPRLPFRDRAPTPSSPLANAPYFSAHDLPSSEKIYPHKLLEASDENLHQSSDVEMSDEEESEFEDEDDESHWSGQNDDLESLVLHVLGHNLPLAAHLIPVLHKVLYTEFKSNITRKVGPWCQGVTTYTSAVGTPSSKQSSSSTSTGNGGSSQSRRKRARISDSGGGRAENSEGEEEEEEDGNEKRRPGDMKRNPSALESVEVRFACPFHKRFPEQYSKGTYRICTGPGWKTIKDVKEHLKRKHYPVQCERCFHIFVCKDRATGLLELEKHTQQATRCEPGQSGMREGISNRQVALLEKKNAKSSQSKKPERTEVEKWFEIWKILFPEVSQPDTPWNDNISIATESRRLSEEENHFCRIFKEILEYEVLTVEDIRFVEGEKDGMIERIGLIAQQAFQLVTGMFERPSTTPSSSAWSHQRSSLGSWQHLRLSTPTNHGRPMVSSLPRSSSGRSQDFGMAASEMSDTTDRAAAPHLYGQYMGGMNMPNTMQQNSAHLRQPSMTSQGNFGPQVQLNANIDPYTDTRFNNNISQNSGQWPQYGYNPGFSGPSNMSGAEAPSTMDTSDAFLDVSPTQDNPHLSNIHCYPPFNNAQQGGYGS